MPLHPTDACHYTQCVTPDKLKPSSKNKPKSDVVKYDDTSDDSDEHEQVNINSRQKVLDNLKQRINHLHRYGENANEFN